MRIVLLTCLTFILIVSEAQNIQHGIFKKSTDIGNPEIKGATQYDRKTNTYTISGGGYNIWFNRDEFQYAYKKIKGDFTLTADFEFIGEGKDPHRKTGWMVRESLSDSSAHISAVDHGDGLTVLQWRAKAGMNMRDPEDEIRAPEQKKYEVIQLQREGNKLFMRIAEKKGDPFIVVGEQEMNLPNEVYAGIFICAHNPQVKEAAIVSDVRIEQ